MKKTLRSHQRGASILLLSFIFMNVLFLVAYALFQVVPAEMHAANRSHTDLKGHFVARAGIQEALHWLEHQMGVFEVDQRDINLPDYNSGSVASPVYPLIDAVEASANTRSVGLFTEGEWRFEIEIQPMQDQLTATNILEARMYAVRSTAFLRNQPIRTVDVMAKQKTFAMFGFLDSSSNPNTPTPMKLTGVPQFKGPVHSNSYFNFDTSGLNYGTAQATFQDAVTHAREWSGAPVNGDGNRYLGTAPYDAAGSYDAIFSGGRSALRLKNTINLPTNTSGLQNNAYPGIPPATPGVKISTGGVGPTGRPLVNAGIFVNGDIDRLNLRLDQDGNQRIDFTQVRQNGSKSVPNGQTCKWRPYSPPRYYQENVSPCLKWSDPGSGGGGGVAGPPAAPVCLQWTQRTRESFQSYDCVPNPPVNQTNWEPFETQVTEVTEAPVTVTGPTGTPVTAGVGQTLVLNRHYDRISSPKKWIVDSVEVLDGQINGTIYVDGNIGKKDDGSDSWSNDSQREGLWGITKGSAKMDSSGGFILDTHGKKVYTNKTIATPLDHEIAIGGDLLQFDAAKFEALGGAAGPNYEQAVDVNRRHRWTDVARNPNAPIEADRLSPNNHHVMGIVTRDVWMNGPKTNGQTALNGGSTWEREMKARMTGNDGVSHIYAVMLAGKNEVLANGAPRLNPDGTPVVSGGFGTWENRRRNTNNGLGQYKVFGGIIQGTTAANYGAPGNHTHHWLDGSGSVGYNVGIDYDREATRQPLFPTLQEFRVVRYFERNART